MFKRIQFFILSHHYVVVTTTYLACILFLHKDILLHLNTYILSGPPQSSGGAFYVWEFSWANRLLRGEIQSNPFYTKELFFPQGTPVIYQSPILTIISLAFSLLANPYQTFNLTAMVMYLLAGLSMYILSYELTRHRLGSALAGFTFMFCHYNLTQHSLGQLQETMLAFAPIFFLALLRLSQLKENSLFLVIFAGIGLAWSSIYLLFEFFFVAMPVFLVTIWPTIRNKRKTFLYLCLCIGIWSIAALMVYFPVLLYRSEPAGGNQFYSMSLLSFLDPPIWHPSSLIQSLRKFTSGFTDPTLVDAAVLIGQPLLAIRATPENLMGYFGLSLLILNVLNLKKSFLVTHLSWISIFIVGMIFSLGPTLQLSYTSTSIPLPYQLFEGIPFLNKFRAPARMIVLSSLAFAVLTAFSFKNTASLIHSRALRILLFFSILSLYIWEMGLTRIENHYTPIMIGETYNYLKKEVSSSALLELPVTITKINEISLNSQKYILYQPYHKKPLAVASTPRYLAASLSSFNSGDYFYELTHPISLKILYEQPKLASRLNMLKIKGREILKKGGIQYIQLHTKEDIIPAEFINLYKRFLDDTLGPFVIHDSYGRFLYKVFDS